MDFSSDLQKNRCEGNPADALEAYHIFRGARTLFFWLILLGLILVQCCFWIADRGYVDAVLEDMSQKTPSVFVDYSDSEKQEAKAGGSGVWQYLPLVSESPEQPVPPGSPNSNPEKSHSKTQLSRPLHAFIKLAIPFSNYIVSIASILYCLSLLVGIQLAIAGRLGGYASAGKAFFISLVLAVLVLPWQPLVTPNMVGTLYSYDYLIQHYILHQNSENLVVDVLYYGRFTGFWFLSILLLLSAQLRSHQAVRMIRQQMSRSLSTGTSSTGIPLGGN